MDDCSSIPQLGYGEFSDWLHRKVGDQRIPISGSLEVTQRCNLRCQHCYIPPDSRAKRNSNELSLSEIQRILDEVTDAGCLWLLLTGGEPLLRKDLLDIYTYARRKGLIVTLFTNGTLVSPRIADYLTEWRPFNIEITLYGATQGTYERVTGIPGSYARCRRGIDLLLERKLPLGLKTMVMTLNQHELEQMKAFAEQLGVRFRSDPILNPALDGSLRPTAFRLSPAEIIEIEKADPQRSSIWREQFGKNQVIPASDRRIFHCRAGRQAFHIDSTGNLSLCPTSRHPSYDLRQGNFQEGWNHFLAQLIAMEHCHDFVCLDCELRYICGQCSAQAELENCSFEKKVEFLCQITKLRRDAFALT